MVIGVALTSGLAIRAQQRNAHGRFLTGSSGGPGRSARRASADDLQMREELIRAMRDSADAGTIMRLNASLLPEK
jgi:hypothetical protein